METKLEEIRNYISLAQSAVEPILHDCNLDKDNSQKQVKYILNNLKYGMRNDEYDGYFFVYDQQGINLVHPIIKQIVGTNQWSRKDSRGDFVIQSLLKLANNNKEGGFHNYWWHKPSTNKEQKKSSYVVILDCWGWMLGTGFYQDDIDSKVTVIEKKIKSNIRRTFYVVLALTIISTVLLGFLVNWRESRLADARLRASVRKFISLQVNERRRFARELHDGINQLMVAAKHRVELAIRQADKEKPEYLEQLSKAKNTMSEVIREVRHISHNLRPSLLDDMGLEVALESLLSQYRERTSTTFSFNYQVDDRQWPEGIDITLYRVIQEALSNIEKYAEAQNVILKLRSKCDSIVLVISDDGKGFSLDQARKKTGIGLQNMRERVELLGGTFTLETSHLTGTRIKVELTEGNQR